MTSVIESMVLFMKVRVIFHVGYHTRADRDSSAAVDKGVEVGVGPDA